MKRVLTGVAILACITGNAQIKQGTIIYERKADLHKHMEDEQMKAMVPQFQTGNYQLVFKDSITVYKAIPKDEAPDPFDGGGGNHIVIKISGSGEDGVLYKNLSSGKQLEQTALEDKKFIITDTIKQLPWKLTDETQTILNHVCKKATLITEKGLNAIAWYAEDIPVAAGPDKFSGLPGAILMLDVDNAFIAFKATEIQTAADTKELKTPTDGKLLTKAEFAKKMDELMGPADAKGRRIITRTN
jgi:GLPGLI family protein